MNAYTLNDAETDLRAALDGADVNTITLAVEAVDRLTPPHPTTASLHSAALWYGSVGLRVFPLTPGTKIPFKGSNGCHDASSNADIIGGWWERHPTANIGIATGRLVDVVDIDGHAGQKSRAEHWDDIFAQVDADNVAKVLTPRKGGMHIYVPATGDGNSAGIVPGVDYRGAGGYVVAPPSRTDQGEYRFLGRPSIDTLAARSAA